MAHSELELDSNIIDVAFSKSNSRLAILTRDRYTVFKWATTTRPIPSPTLESTYPLPEAAESRPTRIALLNEDRVYILRHDRRSNRTRIQQTLLDKHLTDTVYESAENEQVYSIFPSLGHEELWMSRTMRPGTIISYATIISSPAGNSNVTAWEKSPAINTYWAKAVQIFDEKVEETTIF